MTPVTRVEISPGTAGSYQEVDVSAYVDAGNTAGVMLEIVNPTGTEYTWSIRKKGSTDTISNVIEDLGHTWAAIGVDSDDIFEVNISNTNVEIYLVAYIKNDEGTFLTNAVEKTTPSANTWEDVDISGDTGAETALCAFFLMEVTSSSPLWGIRQKGSTDDRRAVSMFFGDLRGTMMAVDANEVCQFRKATTTNPKIHLVGYLTDNFVAVTNASDYSTATTGAYQEVDFSPDIPAGYNGAFVHFYPSTDVEYNGNIRKNGNSDDEYWAITKQQHIWVELDGDRKAEQKIANQNLDLYLWGYTTGASVATNVNKSRLFFI